MWNLNAKFRKILKPIAEKFGVPIQEFLRLYSHGALPNQPRRRRSLTEVMPVNFEVDTFVWDKRALARIERAAAFSGRTVKEAIWESVAGFVDCCEDDMIFCPKTGEPVGDECDFGKFLLSEHRCPVRA